MLMRLLRIAVAAITVVTVVLFGIVYAKEKITTDKTYPVIKVEDGVLEVKTSAKEKDLLQGVTATDGKDGDITDRVLVASISKFSEIGYCKVTYAVSDSDNHVTTAKRQIHYTDYKAPRFKMNRPLLFSVQEDVNVVGIVGARDSLDGDISNNVIIYSPDYEVGVEGKYTIQANVMNSKGDTAQVSLPLVVERTSLSPAEIELKEYLIYCERGKMPDFKSYIKQTYDSFGVLAKFDVTIQTDFNAKKKGTYAVDYHGTDADGHAAHTRLLVIVE